MTLSDVLARHIDDPNGTRHRLYLQTVRQLKCWDCKHTIELPILAVQTTPAPPPFTAPPADARPMPTGFKDRVMAEIRARKDGVA